MAANIKKVFVADASIVLTHLLPDEKSAEIDQIFIDYGKGSLELISVPILSFEVLNGLRSAVLQKRISPKLGEELVLNFLNLKITEVTINYQEVFQEALKKNLSFYDASYVVLAKQKNLKLLTQDKRLKT